MMEVTNNQASAPVEGIQQEQTKESIVQTDPKEASRLAIFAKKEKAQRQLEQQLKQREQELLAREEKLNALQGKVSSSESLEKDLLTDPVGFFEKRNITKEQLINLLSNGPTPELVMSKLEDRLEQKTRELEEKWQTKEKELETKQLEETKKLMRAEIKSLVDADENYSLIKDTDSYETVMEYIQQTFDEDGILLDVDQAAKDVEDYLTEQALKLAQSPKVKLKLTPSEKAEEATATQTSEQVKTKSPQPQIIPRAQPQPQQNIRTLTNAATTNPSKPLSQKDRRARAILAFQGKL